MKNETTISSAVPESSARILNELHAVALFEECDLADTPGGMNKFWIDLRRRELTVTSTLNHILDEHQSAHDLHPRH